MIYAAIQADRDIGAKDRTTMVNLAAEFLFEKRVQRLVFTRSALTTVNV